MGAAVEIASRPSLNEGIARRLLIKGAVLGEATFEQDELVDLERLGSECSRAFEKGCDLTTSPALPACKGDMRMEGAPFGLEPGLLAYSLDLGGKRGESFPGFNSSPDGSRASLLEPADAFDPDLESARTNAAEGSGKVLGERAIHFSDEAQGEVQLFFVLPAKGRRVVHGFEQKLANRLRRANGDEKAVHGFHALASCWHTVSPECQQEFHSPRARATVALFRGRHMSGKSILDDQDYEELLKPLSKELSAMARWVSETKQRMVIIFEGRDTAGKGGSIEMFARVLNPRQCRIVALPSPTNRERTEWYFQRYVEHFPAEGEIVLFDRSWYNRAGVELVMGFCTPEETETFLRAVPRFEQQFVEDGILFYKYWLCCDQAVQEERFKNRLENSMKRWKLSAIDIEARDHYDDYTDAREHMLALTHTDFAPWTLVDFNDQKVGRLTLLRNLLDRVPDTELPLDNIPWPPLPNKPSRERFGVLRPISNFPVPRSDRRHLHGGKHAHEH